MTRPRLNLSPRIWQALLNSLYIMVPLTLLLVASQYVHDQGILALLLSLAATGVIWWYTVSAGFAFFAGALVSLFLFHMPLSAYLDIVNTKLNSEIVPILLFWGGLLALFSRTDLIGASNKARADPNLPDHEQDKIQQQRAVFCLTESYAHFVARLDARLYQPAPEDVPAARKAWRWLWRYAVRSGIKFPMLLSSMVEPALMVMLYKAIWTPNNDGVTENPESRRLALGLLTISVSGALIVFLTPVASVWWLFFQDLTGAVDEQHAVTFVPCSVILYGILSFIHGQYQFDRVPKPVASEATEPEEHTALRRAYMMLVVLFFVLFMAGGAILESTTSAAARADTPIAAPGDTQHTAHAHHPKPKDNTEQAKGRDTSALTVLGTVLALALALILAKTVVNRCMVGHRTPLHHYWEHGAEGIAQVARLLVTIILVMAYAYMLEKHIGHIGKIEAPPRVLGVVVSLALVIVVGLFTGKPLGAFAIAFGVLRLFDPLAPFAHTVLIEGLIILAALSSQFSPASMNAHLLLPDNQCTHRVLGRLWSQKNWGYVPAWLVQLVCAISALAAGTGIRCLCRAL